MPKRPRRTAKTVRRHATTRLRRPNPPPPGAPFPPAAPAVASAGDGGHRVRIRMYRLGVGDCFLLSFPRTDGGTFHMLIDCGIHQAQSGGGDRIRRVVADIQAQTQHRLDVVVGTHEHWDHLSGFSQAADLFKDIAASEIWVAWTENRDDAFAQSLIKKRGAAITALRGAEARLHLGGIEGARNPLTGLLGFFGDGSGKKLAEAGTVLRGMAPPNRIRYREPGEAPIELPGVAARVFVLGPPRSRELIERDAPQKTKSEVYAFGAYAPMLEALEPALAGGSDTPFDSSLGLPLAATRALPFFQRHYWAGSVDDRPDADRLDRTQAWRRIDADWLEAATALALKLDQDTNNTSLVLAIELGEPDKGGPVLLFAADAQVGNWLSWQNLEWKNFHGRRITGPDLLRRTLVYKVGHHASHNATLRELGLELMDALALALVTTDDEMAAKVGWGTLPWPALLERLDQKTNKRVIRTDRPLQGSPAGFRVVSDELFYQIEL